jgi:xanthine dehydrogenase accessory factor
VESNLDNFCQKFLSLSKDGINFVVITLTNVRGSAPQNIGAKLILGEEGILFGTVGGGKIENHCIEEAVSLLKKKDFTAPYSQTWNLQKDIGMTCGGEVSFLFESCNINSRWNIAIFGAGHISQELSRTLLSLNCYLKVIDNRKEWLDKLPTHPRLTKIHNETMKDEVKNLADNTFVALMTMGHAKDVPILFEALTNRNFPYLGVIGSQSKRNTMEKELKEQGLNEELVKSFICPLGEDIGTNSPAEISISITAQLLKLRDSRS